MTDHPPPRSSASLTIGYLPPTITFKGQLAFADEWRLEQGLDAFFATEPHETFVDLEAFRRDGLVIAVDFSDEGHDGHVAPAVRKLAALARHAAAGRIDGEANVIAAGNAEPDASRPRHHGWDLWFAARAGDAARLRELARRGAALDRRYGLTRATLLFAASRRDAADAVAVLIEAGVDVHAVTSYGWTALFGARLPITRALLAAGADPNARSDDSSVLLSSLTLPEEVALCLLDAGAVPEPADYAELARTCATIGRISVLREVVARWPQFRAALASPDVISGAIGSRDPVTLDYLLEQGATLPDDFLEQVLRWPALEFLEAALRAPDAIAKCGPSSRRADAMCSAAHRGHIDLMSMLAAHGVPLHPTEQGETNPQKEASRAGHAKALAWLRERVPYDEEADQWFNSDRDD